MVIKQILQAAVIYVLGYNCDRRRNLWYEYCENIGGMVSLEVYYAVGNRVLVWSQDVTFKLWSITHWILLQQKRFP